MDGSRSSKREMTFFRFVHKVPPLVYESGIFWFPLIFEIPPCRFDVVSVWLLVFYTLIL